MAKQITIKAMLCDACSTKVETNREKSYEAWLEAGTYWESNEITASASMTDAETVLECLKANHV